MELYLVRHTTPQIEKGLCYGQSDIGVTETFHSEAELIREALPADPGIVYSSPLQRCRVLADHLFPASTIRLEPDLMEINCGKWELMHWDKIPPAEINPWMEDFVNVSIPGGENYIDVFNRTVACFNRIREQKEPGVLVTHGGVIRSILSYVTNTPLRDSFGAFSLHYGCVVRIGHDLSWQILHNIEGKKEQHKPSSYYEKEK